MIQFQLSKSKKLLKKKLLEALKNRIASHYKIKNDAMLLAVSNFTEDIILNNLRKYVYCVMRAP